MPSKKLQKKPSRTWQSNIMPKKIHTLKEKEIIDFGLIGISTPENDYRMSWMLNNAFEFKLSRREDLEIFHRKLDDPQAFHQFRYFDEESMMHYRLLANKCENGYLLEEMPNLDYILQIIGELDREYIEGMVRKLRSLDGIALAASINPASLKSRKKLML
jgi:hypothetical protein